MEPCAYVLCKYNGKNNDSLKTDGRYHTIGISYTLEK